MKLSLALPLLAAFGMSAWAGPLQRSDLPADPAWVIHMDCDGLRPTAIGSYLLAEMQKPEAQARFAAFQSIFSFDPRSQLHGMTLYSTGISSADGILVVYADFDSAQLVLLAKAARDYQETAYKQHTIYSWTDEKRNKGGDAKARTYAAILGNRVIFGQQEQRVAHALDIINNVLPTLAGNRALFPNLGSGGPSAYIQAAGRNLNLPGSDPNAAMFRLSRALIFDLGETGGTVNAQLVMEANDSEVAGHILSIGQGLVALMKLQQEKPETVRFAESLGLRQEGSQVIVSMGMPAGGIIEFMKSQAARKATVEKASATQK